MIYILVGRTCSGKTSIAKELEKLGVKRIITYTTRPPRSGEVNGVDYYFISEKEFEDKRKDGFFAEVTYYRGTNGNNYYYGSALDDYISDEDKVIVLNPYGVKNLRDKGLNTKVIFISCSDYIIFKRSRSRGDSKEVIEKRLERDKRDFNWFADHIPILWDIEICSNLISNSSSKDIAKAIRKNYRSYNEDNAL